MRQAVRAGPTLFKGLKDLDADAKAAELKERLVAKGLVRAIGLSNFNAAQIDRVVASARIQPSVLQVECHPRLNQAALLAHAIDTSIHHMLALIERRNKSAHISRCINRIETGHKHSGAEDLGKASCIVLKRLTGWRYVSIIQTKIVSPRIDACG